MLILVVDEKQKIDMYRWAALIDKQDNQSVIDTINSVGSTYLLQYKHPNVEYDSATLLPINKIYGMYYDCGEFYILTKDYRFIDIILSNEPKLISIQLKRLTLCYYRFIMLCDTIKFEFEEISANYKINRKRNLK